MGRLWGRKGVGGRPPCARGPALPEPHLLGTPPELPPPSGHLSGKGQPCAGGAHLGLPAWPPDPEGTQLTGSGRFFVQQSHPPVCVHAGASHGECSLPCAPSCMSQGPPRSCRIALAVGMVPESGWLLFMHTSCQQRATLPFSRPCCLDMLGSPRCSPVHIGVVGITSPRVLLASLEAHTWRGSHGIEDSRRNSRG